MDGLLTELSAAVTPALVALFGTVATVIINRAAKVAQDRWGIEIESKHREALHSALTSGVLMALSRGLTGDAVVTAAVRHAADSVPDAVSALNPAGGVLTTIAEAKFREVVGKVAGK